MQIEYGLFHTAVPVYRLYNLKILRSKHY